MTLQPLFRYFLTASTSPALIAFTILLPIPLPCKNDKECIVVHIKLNDSCNVRTVSLSTMISAALATMMGDSTSTQTRWRDVTKLRDPTRRIADSGGFCNSFIIYESPRTVLSKREWHINWRQLSHHFAYNLGCWFESQARQAECTLIQESGHLRDLMGCNFSYRS